VTSKRTYAVVRLRTEEGLDGLHRLLAGGLDAQDGCAVVPEGPGLGLAFDWDAVRSFARG
jgi:L-alanine-DL-glutamate epimerase-like enolase superfamily enzyme